MDVQVDPRPGTKDLSSIATDVVWVSAVAQIQSVAQELPHDTGVALKLKKIKK